MDMTFPEEEGTSSVDMLKATEEMYREVTEELALAIRNIREGDVAEAKAARAAVRDLRAALQLAMEERNRVEKLRREAAGVVRGYALDFDAARLEIGRRLARLRDA
ncbi:hypothetical protein RYZ20_03665 [Thioclava sp. A2]|uniref:hypothetical protein n=1 Tax=Thioclava sp. FCG-A2 TaxID=3080562 RepID=UPI002954619B|nr:hypothetical protein [Thioclava sp. A2]MDV7269994.1 hypothetical protein [Thioclava sp. A2]